MDCLATRQEIGTYGPGQEETTTAKPRTQKYDFVIIGPTQIFTNEEEEEDASLLGWILFLKYRNAIAHFLQPSRALLIHL